ncbi:glutaredoxin domain-containing cysteine-rich protein CG31559-like [Coccinella septempunctata]|uniref:glutaredoxin domain-containing cysteine-rich protein CG31559-like n=1 Tax=Coccinella septempunctata TaxID=41139 RepID=UPI001D07802E|nr:glutaredoxin domain-containing cysteine-rich protein CG31559-like [Coccinella septempunctata]
MEDPSMRPPPLPPKARKSPPATSTTVLTNCIIQDDYNRNHRFLNTLDVQQETKSNTHVVKIQINPSQESYANGTTSSTSVTCVVSPCIKISVNTDGEMVHNKTMVDSSTETNGYFFYDQFHGEVMSSGQISPSDTLDSGTCSDLDGTPPPISSKKTTGISVTIIGEKTKGLSSLNSSGTEIDSDDNESNVSYEAYPNRKVPLIINHIPATKRSSSNFLPQTLLQDIRNAKISDHQTEPKPVLIEEKSYVERKEEDKQKCEEIISSKKQYETDKYYDFHLNENDPSDAIVPSKNVEEDETFAGYKDLMGDGASTIRSAKGTVRGVKNRVRAGIATFLQINSNTKNYKEKEAGKVVVYTTTMGIIRDTYQACMKVKQILRTLLIKFEERDVFMSSECQQEIRERMRCDDILIPQVFVDGQHIGDAETIEKLNESGELRRILKPFKSMDACNPCKVCGGFRLLPCTVCNGSKKSVHRNHFTAEFVALKCMNCDEVGLVRCTACC